MKRFSRSAALASAALVALVLAIAASATTAKSDRSTAPSASAAVTNYLTYVKGKPGKADPKKSKVSIGWVNQQGGQVVIGRFATDGAELAVKYVNEELGGVGGHPVAAQDVLHQPPPRRRARPAGRSWPPTSDDLGDRDGRRGDRQPSRSTPRSRGAKPVDRRCGRHAGRRRRSRTRSVLFGDATHMLGPFGTYAKDVLKAKTAALVYPSEPGIIEGARAIRRA